ncbi:chemotaxis protein CheX [Candidatus Bipolaricaulota bacterium]|nr:chemotaxis protein CheX [Candidatus Bipolaricaulota bacterium]
MQQQKSATLTAIFSDVLANLAFMFTDDEDSHSEANGVWSEASIEYYGCVNGALRLVYPEAFAIELAANLLGTDPGCEDAESQAGDAVKELMNIVCGQLVTALHGTEAVFNLSIPRVRVLPEAPTFSGEENENICTLCVSGRRTQISLIPSSGCAPSDA